MSLHTMLKVGQVLGALLMIAGVASCQMHHYNYSTFMVIGALLYGGCRLAAWFKKEK
jgi:hypothetical protein